MTSSELRDYLRQTGLTQAGLAQQLGVATITVKKWLQGPEKSGRQNRIPEPIMRLIALIERDRQLTIEVEILKLKLRDAYITKPANPISSLPAQDSTESSEDG